MKKTIAINPQIDLSNATNPRIENGKLMVDIQEKEALNLQVSLNNHLNILYKGKKLGFISPCGECYILSDDIQCEAWEQWNQDGRPIDSTPVEWRGRSYYISELLVLCSKYNNDITSIYDFEDGTPATNCKDPNIIRLSNGTVRIF